jgi:hypothetical protein
MMLCNEPAALPRPVVIARSVPAAESKALGIAAHAAPRRHRRRAGLSR